MKYLITAFILMTSLTLNAHENNTSGLIEVFPTDNCSGSANAIVPIGESVNCTLIHQIARQRNLAWAMKVSGSDVCVDIADTTVEKVCQAYNANQ